MVKKPYKVYYTGAEGDKPQVKIQGRVLREAGFRVGDQYRVEVEPGQLVLIKVERG